MDFFFPDGSGIFQDNNVTIHGPLVVKKWSTRSHFHTNWLPQSPDTLTPLKVFGVKGKDWRNGSTLLSSIQNLGQKLMQLRMEINVVTLHKVVETMPQQMHSVIKAKGGLLQKTSVQLFFWTGSVFCNYFVQVTERTNVKAARIPSIAYYFLDLLYIYKQLFSPNHIFHYTVLKCSHQYIQQVLSRIYYRFIYYITISQ